MSKGAATEQQLSVTHRRLARVMHKVLQVYDNRLAFIERVNSGDTEALEQLEGDMLDELFNDDRLPSPAMLTAIANFLRQNSITVEIEKQAEMTALQKRLADKENRGKIVNIRDLPKVHDA